MRLTQEYRFTPLTAAQIKVPAVTLGFWLVKIVATTLGETAGDTVSISLGWGYLHATGLFMLLFGTTLALQVRALNFSCWRYWATMITTTTLGTTLADFFDRALGIGYPGGAACLSALLITCLTLWYLRLGSIALQRVDSRPAELFYWSTIMISQTLGTALGDWTADSIGMGYSSGVLLFTGLLSVLAMAHWKSMLTSTSLFWLAFILTRPLGAVLGDLLDKPPAEGGLGWDRLGTSLVLLLFMAALLKVFPHQAAKSAH